MGRLAAAIGRRCWPDPIALGPILPSSPRSAPPSPHRRAAATAVDRSAVVPPCARCGRGRRPAPVPCRSRGPPPPHAWAGLASRQRQGPASSAPTRVGRLGLLLRPSSALCPGPAPPVAQSPSASPPHRAGPRPARVLKAFGV